MLLFSYLCETGASALPFLRSDYFDLPPSAEREISEKSREENADDPPERRRASGCHLTLFGPRAITPLVGWIRKIDPIVAGLLLIPSGAFVRATFRTGPGVARNISTTDWAFRGRSE